MRKIEFINIYYSLLLIILAVVINDLIGMAIEINTNIFAIIVKGKPWQVAYKICDTISVVLSSYMCLVYLSEKCSWRTRQIENEGILKKSTRTISKVIARTRLFQTNKYIVVLVTFCFFYSCKGQSADVDSCKLNIKIARKNINDFYQNNDKLLLTHAMNSVNKSIQCKETRLGGIEIKLSIYMLLKDYKTGQMFVDSLSETDFKYKYKRFFWSNYFAASDAEFNSDTLDRDKYYSEIIKNVESYINTEDEVKGTFDKEAYYDLFYIKQKVVSQKEVYEQIDKLENKYPSEKIFLESLKSTFYENPVSSKDIE